MVSICIVLGSARCVWDDYLEAVNNCHEPFEVMCINDIIMHFPGNVKHAYSNDAQMLPKWEAARRPGYPRVGHLHSNNGAGGSVNERVKIWDWVHGNSGVNAVLTALALGYRRVIVCGIPLDNTGHYFSPHWGVSGYDNEASLDEWRKHAVEWGNSVISMSGNTREILNGGIGR